MKKFLAILLSLFICLTAAAQVENSIILDSKSFRAVQKDALTGVNIDPIGVDHSRQACARVKIKFDRMNKVQIDALEVKMRSNTDLTKQKVADYYDNVLILEMTAKPNTRFYFVSPEFGESNEVTLNLEPNREYEMLASLNQTYSIIVDSNVAGADVYLDGIFKGQTDDNYRCIVSDVLIGLHALKITFGNAGAEQSIVVHNKSIAFKQDVTHSTTIEHNTTTKSYRVGDYYNENGKEGVVFEVSADGHSGKIVSMIESPEHILWTSDKKSVKCIIGADNKENGAYNMDKIRSIYDWKRKYPAFKWCADLGEEWYLPSIEELDLLLLNDSVRGVVNRTLLANNRHKLSDKKENKLYWSSSESEKRGIGYSCVWVVNMNNSKLEYGPKGNIGYAVGNIYQILKVNIVARAVATFGKEHTTPIKDVDVISTEDKYYKVRKGDTLGNIAKQKGTTIDELCRLNGIKPTKRLVVGHVLRVK